MEKITITIVGGGFCGMLTAAHLCKAQNVSLKIIIINAKYPFAKGIAYSPYSRAHLLNVPAGKMSAYASDPDHFIKWLQENVYHDQVEDQVLSKTFLPRHLYGQYLAAVWQEALKNKSREVEVELIHDEVIDMECMEGRTKVHLKESLSLETDYVVLATGNAVPRDPVIPNKAFFSSPNYFANPWTADSVTGLPSGKDLLIIGNGLTMVDTVLGIMERGFQGKIHAISPHGYSILSHRHQGMVYNTLKLPEPYSLTKVLHTVNKHVRLTASLGISPEPLIDALRPFVSKIWTSLNQQEKESFMRHLCHKWNIARHRLPLHIYDSIQKLQLQGKLVVVSGKIKDITENENEISVLFQRRHSNEQERIAVGRIINCTGPETNISNSSNALLKNLAAKGIIACDALKLGMNADPRSGNIIDARGKLRSNMFTLGASLKGVLWESTAVPELRAQAERLAHLLVNHCKSRRNTVFSNAA